MYTQADLTKMPNLVNYCRGMTAWARLFDQPVRQTKPKLYEKTPEEVKYNPLKLTDVQVQKIWDKLDAELSPENLTCDGELSMKEVRKKASYLRHVAKELALFYRESNNNMYHI